MNPAQIIQEMLPKQVTRPSLSLGSAKNVVWYQLPVKVGVTSNMRRPHKTINNKYQNAAKKIINFYKVVTDEYLLA